MRYDIYFYRRPPTDMVYWRRHRYLSKARGPRNFVLGFRLDSPPRPPCNRYMWLQSPFACDFKCPTDLSHRASTYMEEIKHSRGRQCIEALKAKQTSHSTVAAVEKLSEDVSRKILRYTVIRMYRTLTDPKYRTRFPTTCTYVLARNLKYSGRCDGLVEAVIILGSDSTSRVFIHGQISVYLLKFSRPSLAAFETSTV